MAHFYAIHSRSELEWSFSNCRPGVEIKFQDAPRLTLPMRIAMEDLALNGPIEVYPSARE